MLSSGSYKSSKPRPINKECPLLISSPGEELPALTEEEEIKNQKQQEEQDDENIQGSQEEQVLLTY